MIRRPIDVLMLVFWLTFSGVSLASTVIDQFDTPAQEKLYQQLIAELRCLVCQNQNIADSDADLAKDLREKTYELVKQNQDEAYIKDYMQQRFGDFVLYSPPLNLNTLLLWGLPLVVLGLALFGFIFKLRNQNSPH